MSILLLIILVGGFVYQFVELYMNPNFLNYPPTYDFSSAVNPQLYPSSGNTVAVYIDNTNYTSKDLRV